MSGILQGLIGSLKSAASSAADAYFNLTTLLLNTSSTNGAQNNTFLDSSTNNFTITRNGNTTQGTFTPFSQTGWSTYFSGASGTRLTYPGSSSAYVSGTGDFTIEMWINIDPASAGRSRVLIEGDVSNGIQFRLGPNNTTNINGLSVSRVFNADNEYCSYTFEFNTWYHVAVVRASAVYYFFVNGVQQTTQGSGTSTYSFATPSTVSIGDNASYPNDEIYKGHISNIRVSNVGRYTSNFTPSTTALTALSGTQFLSLQNNRFVDNSTNASAITSVGSNGTPSVQAFSPFAPTAAYDAAVVGGSGYFDGSGDYLSVAYNSALSAGTGDFMAEFWVYHTTSAGSTNMYFSIGQSSGIAMYRTSGAKIQVDQDGVANLLTSTNNVPVNAWTHIALARSGTSLKLFMNGVQEASATNSTNFNGTGVTTIMSNNGSNLSTGHVCGFRFLKGTAQYTAAFTPPTAPPTAITNTSLLLNYTNSGIYDSTAKNVLETVGNAQVSTTQAKWGTTSLYLDGTGDYLVAPANQLYSFGTGDFTIECWIRPISVNSAKMIVTSGYDSSTGGGGWGFVHRADISSLMFTCGSNVTYTKAWSPTANTWYHVAVSRSGTNIRLFVDGTQIGTTSTSSDNITSTSPLVVGGNLGGGANLTIDAYIDDLRITKGYARYTANFTAPTAAFPLQ